MYIACTSAYTVLGLLGATAMPTLPKTPVGSPDWCVMLVQCAPPSVVLYMPLPGPPLEKVQWLRDICHIDAYTTLGLVGSMARL